MTESLKNRVALITGGGGSIGRSAALAMAREGAKIIVADHAQDAAETSANIIRAAGGEVTLLVGDVNDPDYVERLVSLAMERFGRLDIAFNNAGIGGAHVGCGGFKLADWTVDGFDQLMGVCLRGVFLCMKAELGVMLKQGSGVIVNTSSTAGVSGLAGSSVYSAAKHGVIGLTRSAAVDYGRNNIRVNAICPGTIETNMSAEPMRRRGSEVLAQIPMGRIGTPDEIGEFVTWLSSDRASYITGASYVIDGGFLA